MRSSELIKFSKVFDIFRHDVVCGKYMSKRIIVERFIGRKYGISVAYQKKCARHVQADSRRRLL